MTHETVETDSRAKAIARLAAEFIADCAPGVPRTTAVVEKIATEWEVTDSAARRWLRQAIEEELLVELRPDYNWQVRVGEERLYLKRTYPAGRGRLNADHQYELSSEGIHDGYRPGNKTFLTTPERAEQAVADKRARIAQAKAEAEAQEAAKRAAYRAHKTEENQEIDRREPGLRELLVRLKDAMGSDRIDEARVNLFDPPLADLDEVIPLADQELALRVQACTPQGVAVLRRILEAGLAALEKDKREQSA